MNEANLFAASQELARALALCQEASEESLAADEGHGTPEQAEERSRAADAALGRCEATIAGLRFVYRRGVEHYMAAKRQELRTGIEYRGGNEAA